MASPFAGRGLAVEQPFRVAIVGEGTSEPMRATIEGKDYEAYVNVYSTDSARANKIRKAITDKRIKRRANAEDMIAEKVDLYAELTESWCIIDAHGDVVDAPCTPENARLLYSDPAWAWLYDQVIDGAGTRANFLPKPKTIS